MESLQNDQVVDYPVAEGTTVIGMFKDGETAERAYNVLRERGYNTKDINLVMTDDTRKKYYAHGKTELGTKAMAGAGAGSAIGATLGAAAGELAAIGTSILIPGLGMVIVGPIAAGIAGAGAGGMIVQRSLPLTGCAARCGAQPRWLGTVARAQPILAGCCRSAHGLLPHHR